jgi:hypothetical protein
MKDWKTISSRLRSNNKLLKFLSLKGSTPKQSVLLSLIALAIIGGVLFGLKYAMAEQSGSTPESNATSRIKTLYTDLSTLTFGSDTDTPDWGDYWNRIKTAAKWVPNGTAATGDVLTGKTFFNTTRTAQNGAYNATNLSTATVKSGTAFGVGLTGAYPSASNLLPGAGTVAGTGDVKTGKVAWSNDGTQISGTYSPVAGGPCPTQQYYDGHASATEVNNCSLTWVAASSPRAGEDDNKAGRGPKDPMTGLTWSLYLKNNAGTVQFAASSGSSWSWDASAAANVAVGNRTASQICTDRGNGWRLPTEKELLQAYIDGAYWNLTQPSNNYWSLTESSSTGAYNVVLNDGYTTTSIKTNAYSVRCVR